MVRRGSKPSGDLESVTARVIKAAQSGVPDSTGAMIDALLSASQRHSAVQLAPGTLNTLVDLLRGMTTAPAAAMALFTLIEPSQDRAGQVASNGRAVSELVALTSSSWHAASPAIAAITAISKAGHSAVFERNGTLVANLLHWARRGTDEYDSLEECEHKTVTQAWNLLAGLTEQDKVVALGALELGAQTYATAQLAFCKTSTDAEAISTFLVALWDHVPPQGISTGLMDTFVQGFQNVMTRGAAVATAHLTGASRGQGARGRGSSSSSSMASREDRDEKAEDAMKWDQACDNMVSLLRAFVETEEGARQVAKRDLGVLRSLAGWVGMKLELNLNPQPAALQKLIALGGTAAVRAVASISTDNGMSQMAAVWSVLEETQEDRRPAEDVVRQLRPFCRQSKVMSTPAAAEAILGFCHGVHGDNMTWNERREALLCIWELVASPTLRVPMNQNPMFLFLLAHCLVFGRNNSKGSSRWDASIAAAAQAAALVVARMEGYGMDVGALEFAVFAAAIKSGRVPKLKNPPSMASLRVALLMTLWENIRPAPQGASPERACAAAKMGAQAAAALAACANTAPRRVAVALALLASSKPNGEATVKAVLELFDQASTALVARSRAATSDPSSSSSSGSSSSTQAAGQPALPAMAASPLLHATCANILQLLLRLHLHRWLEGHNPGAPKQATDAFAVASRALESGAPLWRRVAGCKYLTCLAMLALAPGWDKCEASAAGGNLPERLQRYTRVWSVFATVLLEDPISAGAGCRVCCRVRHRTMCDDGADEVAKRALEGGSDPLVMVELLLSAAEDRMVAPRGAWCGAIDQPQKQQQKQQQQQQQEEEEEEENEQQQSSDSAAGGPLACAVCGTTGKGGAPLKVCAGCRGVWYCGQACARVDWVRRGHRQDCETVQFTGGYR